MLESGVMSVTEFAGIQQVYFGGDMEAAPALAGQSAGLIHSVASVQSIIENTLREFYEISARMSHIRF
jgi:enoyl-[acyl-carrier protein] reductase II